MLHTKLKMELHGACNCYEDDEKYLSIPEAEFIEKLIKIIDNSSSAILLRQQIQISIDSFAYKTFGFLPWIPDLKRRIEKVLENDCYKLKFLLAEDNMNLREDNFQLYQQVEILRQHFHQANPQTSTEINKLAKKIQVLTFRLDEQAQQNKILKKENQILIVKFESQSSENIELKKQLKKALIKEEALNSLHSNVIAENETLLLEIDTLKKQLAQLQPKFLVNDSEKEIGFSKFYSKR